MAKILLLGATGLLGSAFKDFLLQNDNFLSFYPNRKELDVLDFSALKKYIDNVQPDFVINCTGYNAVDKAELPDERDSCVGLNVTVPTNLAKLSTDLSFKLVQFSSDYVFNGESALGYDEFAQTDPINFYGETKLLAENAITQYSNDFIIQRISWLFGPGKTNFVDYVYQELNADRTIKIVTDQIGTPTFSIDVVKACISLINNNNEGIFHTTNTDSVSWFQLAAEVCRLLKKPLDLVQPILSSDLNRLAKRPACSILYTTRTIPLRSHKLALIDYLNI